jgi:hypothetical protein
MHTSFIRKRSGRNIQHGYYSVEELYLLKTGKTLWNHGRRHLTVKIYH